MRPNPHARTLLDFPPPHDSNAHMGVEIQIRHLVQRLKAGEDPAIIESQYEKLLASSPYIGQYLKSAAHPDVVRDFASLPTLIRQKSAQREALITKTRARILQTARDNLFRNTSRAAEAFDRDLKQAGQLSGDRQTLREQYEQIKREVLRDQIDSTRTKLLSEAARFIESDFLAADESFERMIREKAFFIGDPATLRDEYNSIKAKHVRSRIGSKSGLGAAVRELSEEQSRVVALANANVQVTARAGSGKTFTLVSRAVFLQRYCNVQPSQILLLAFNRKAAAELRERLLCELNDSAASAITRAIQIRSETQRRQSFFSQSEIRASAVDEVAATLGVELPHVMTFHSLAYALVHPEGQIVHDSADDESFTLSRMFQEMVDARIQQADQQELIRRLMVGHFREDWDTILKRASPSGNEQLLAFRRSLPRETLRGEFVKSFGEKAIADFLFEHDIPYKYERNHWWDGMNYRPDFTIQRGPTAGIVIEYFGLEGDVDYDTSAQRKRAFWATQKTWALVEMSPREFQRNGLSGFREELQKRLCQHGVLCQRLPDDEVWQRIRDRCNDRFSRAMSVFALRCRKVSLSPRQLRERIAAHRPLTDAERMFVDMAATFYDDYLTRLERSGNCDFDGLVQQAALMIATGETVFDRRSSSGDLRRLRFVCVDEFQDFSDLFYRMLAAMKECNPGLRLCCVGDDWQAINGFAGSELRFFRDAERYLHLSQRLEMSSNYRSARRIVTISNALMRGLGTAATAVRRDEGEVWMADLGAFLPTVAEEQQFPGDSISPALLRLLRREIGRGYSTVVLCRRNGIPWYVSDQSERRGDRGALDRFCEFLRSFLPSSQRNYVHVSTTHAYKGLEKQSVVLLDVVARSYPLIHPDWVFSRVLGDSLAEIIDEERRLLYVAMTRAIDCLYIVTDGAIESPFLDVVKDHGALRPVDWDGLAPTTSAVDHWVVRVRNASGCRFKPTYSLRDDLRRAGFSWRHDGSMCWAKTIVPLRGDVRLPDEDWVSKADGVEIEISSATGKVIGLFRVDLGVVARAGNASSGSSGDR